MTATTLLLAAMGIVFVSQFVKAIAGFGSGLIAIPILTLLYGPSEAVIIENGIDLVSAMLLIPSVRKSAAPKLIISLLIPLIIGQFVGTYVLAHAPTPLLRILLAVLIVIVAIQIAWKKGGGTLGSETHLTTAHLIPASLAGSAGGVMSGMFGMSGPPILYFMQKFFHPEFYRANMLILFSGSSCTLLAMLGWRGLLEPSHLWQTSALLPAMFAGTFIGSKVRHQFSPRFFKWLIVVILMVSSLFLVT